MSPVSYTWIESRASPRKKAASRQGNDGLCSSYHYGKPDPKPHNGLAQVRQRWLYAAGKCSKEPTGRVGIQSPEYCWCKLPDLHTRLRQVVIFQLPEPKAEHNRRYERKRPNEQWHRCLADQARPWHGDSNPVYAKEYRASRQSQHLDHITGLKNRFQRLYQVRGIRPTIVPKLKVHPPTARLSVSSIIVIISMIKGSGV